MFIFIAFIIYNKTSDVILHIHYLNQTDFIQQFMLLAGKDEKCLTDTV